MWSSRGGGGGRPLTCGGSINSQNLSFGVQTEAVSCRVCDILAKDLFNMLLQVANKSGRKDDGVSFDVCTVFKEQALFVISGY